MIIFPFCVNRMSGHVDNELKVRMTVTKSLRFILNLWSINNKVHKQKKGSCLFSYFAPIEWEVMVTLGGGLQAVESLPGGVPTYSLCISLPIFLYFSSHFGDGINLAEKHFVSYPARTRARRAHALRALGLLLADGAPTVGGGKTFWTVSRIFLRKQL